MARPDPGPQQPMEERFLPHPPQNLDAEESVLGAMMLSANAVETVSEILNPDGSEFYRETHGAIYRAGLALHGRGEPVDAITVMAELDRSGVAKDFGPDTIGPEKVQELASLVPAAASAGHWARIVVEMARLRDYIRVGQRIVQMGYEREGEIADLQEEAEGLVFGLSQRDHNSDLVPASVAATEAYQALEERVKSGRDIIGTPTGLGHLDGMTSGLQRGALIVLAARPSMGKSALALCISANVAIRKERPVALFTLEMSRDEIMQRMMSSEALVDSTKIRNGKGLGPDDWQKVINATGKIDQAPLWIDDSALLTVGEIRSKARRLKARRPDLALVVVDYLQLMATKGGEESRVQEVSKISRALKILARELDTPVLALSQLSRAVEQRHDKRPILSDLRESGSIEQDADLVAFLYRDEYYNPEEVDQAGIAEVILAKQRNGPTGTVKLAFQKHYARFGDLAMA